MAAGQLESEEDFDTMLYVLTVKLRGRVIIYA